MTQAYPLQWPAGRPRKSWDQRKRASFGKKVPSGHGWDKTESLTVADARSRLQDELDRLGARNFVLSTNVELRLDGPPRSGQAEPKDPAVALYFNLKGKPHCLPCDTYDRVADNITAIAKHIEATRAIARYGVADLAEMFTGFQALPMPEQWWDVLGVSSQASAEQINSAYRAKAKTAHSDAGGSDAAMSRLNVARDAGIRASQGRTG